MLRSSALVPRLRQGVRALSAAALNAASARRAVAALRPLATAKRGARTVSAGPLAFLQRREFASALLVRAPEAKSLAELSDSFLTGTSAGWIEALYLLWQTEPGSVPAEWAAYFTKVDAGLPSSQAGKSAASPAPAPSAATMTRAAGAPPTSHLLTVKVMLLIRAYEVRGHNLANLDPLGLEVPEPVPELALAYYGLTESDRFDPTLLGEFGAFLGTQPLSLAELVAQLKKIYCRTIGYEYMHIQSREECNFVRARIQHRHDYFWINEADKKRLLDRLTWSDQFEAFLAKKFGVEKRFGLEGGESLIPGLKELIDCSADMGVQSVVLGMPHRGRLNVLANVVRKPMERIFREFAGVFHPTEERLGSGDVKYHLGASYDRETRSGKTIQLSLLANPSHLEAVNPVVLGRARAKQHRVVSASNDEAKSRIAVMPILLHGDAAFSGQGIVYEGFHLSELPNYTVGGTIHVVVNNQVGFTTDPKDGRSSRYCTDVAKTLNVPVLHVNGDDPEAVVKCFRFAAVWRNTFMRDIVIDIQCYRRSGHNEVDEPFFTQPLMYAKIRKHPSTLKLYTDRLIAKGVVTAAEAKALVDRAGKIMEERFDGQVDPAKTTPTTPSAVLRRDKAWSQLVAADTVAAPMETRIARSVLLDIANVLTSPPPQGFTLHRTLSRIIEAKKASFEGAGAVDWGTAEALAMGSLLLEGTHVRLSGQDVQRGTFSHRHAVWHCQKTSNSYTPLNNLPGKIERLTVSNSPLDEFAVLGYEYGYSLESPNSLVMWEAQFGDFSNGAQVMVDQFISSGEQKWFQQSGLVMLLPHGYDGQGPEHSSARLERFLQMSDQDFDLLPREATLIQDHAWQVCNITSPANYFHALRRQVHRQFRKPLIIMSPKALLRDPRAASSLAEFTDTPYFKPFIGDSGLATPPSAIRRVILCSGQVYYDLVDERTKRKADDVAIVRIEQLAPLPSASLASHLAAYSKAELMWCQEEAKNHGAYLYMLPHLHTILDANESRQKKILYAGRPTASAPATGLKAVHKHQKHDFLDAAFA